MSKKINYFILITLNRTRVVNGDLTVKTFVSTIVYSLLYFTDLHHQLKKDSNSKFSGGGGC